MAQQETNQTNIKPASSGARRGLFISVTAVVIAILVLGALKLYNNHLNSKNNYQYQTLNSQNSTTTTVDSLTFAKPNEFKQTHKLAQDNNTTAIYTDIDKAGYTIGLMGASVAKNDQASDAKYRDGINYLMKLGSGDDYDAFASNFKSFIGGITGSNYSIQLGQPQAYTNANIKGNAWAFDITAAPAGRLASMQGKFIYAIGNKNISYFTIITLKSNWQSNISVWNQVVNSLKIAE